MPSVSLSSHIIGLQVMPRGFCSCHYASVIGQSVQDTKKIGLNLDVSRSFDLHTFVRFSTVLTKTLFDAV